MFVALDDELNREVAVKQILDSARRRPRQPRSGSCSRPRSPAGWSIPASCRSTAWAPTPTAGRYYAMRFIRGDVPEGGDRAVPRRPRRLKTRSRPALAGASQALAAVHRRLQRDRLRPQPRGACTATSSRATSWWASTARRCVVDWGLAKATGKSDPSAGERTLAAQLGERQLGDAAGLGPRHAGLHEPRAGRGRPRGARPAQRRLQPGRDAVLSADRQAAVRGRRHRRGASSRATRASSRRPAGRTVDRPGAGGGLPEGDGASSPPTATPRPRRWPTTSSGGWRMSR